MEEKTLNLYEVAESLNVSYWTAWRLCLGGALAYQRVGKRFRVRGADLLTYQRASYRPVRQQA